MQLSSPRFKALAVSAGISFWSFIILNSIGSFTFEIFIPLVITVFGIFQLISKKLVMVLDWFAIINTKIFLGITFVLVFSIYGILFRIFRIDLLRKSVKESSYWLEMKALKTSNNFKQY
jgi:hypothetical protein